MTYVSYGVIVSLTTLLTCCMTMTLVYNEFLWWFLLLPACLVRVQENASPSVTVAPSPSKQGAQRGPRRETR